MRRTYTSTIVALLALTLAGCSTAPDRADVAERFAIELAASGAGDVQDWMELADGLAGDALDGRCESEAYRTGLADDSLVRAWDIGCLMYFEAEMSESQVERAKLHLAD